MPRKLPFDVAVGSLLELVDGMVRGEELVLTVQGEPKAVVTKPARTSWPCQPGTAKDTRHWMAPDFDAPLEDFSTPTASPAFGKFMGNDTRQIVN